MHLGIFAKTFVRPTLEQTLDAVAGHGLTHVQFNMSCMGLATLPDRLDEGACVWIAQQFRERGLTMAAISGTFNMCDPSKSRLENNVRRLEVLAAACRWLDTRIITLCTGTRDRDDMWKWNPANLSRSSWDDLLHSMKEAVKIADRHEVTLAFEPEINNVVNSVMRARKLLDEVGSPWLKVVIDPANLVQPGQIGRTPEIFDEAFEWLGPDIALAHAKEGQLNESDAAELMKIRDETVSRITRIEVRRLVNEARTAQAGTDLIETASSKYPARRLLMEPLFHFFHLYFVRLRKIGYTGAVVAHGLAESEVNHQISFLRETLDAPALPW
jgi:sugar phosphate isomerase/epimerase